MQESVDASERDGGVPVVFPMRLVGICLLLVWDWGIHDASTLRLVGGVAENALDVSGVSAVSYVVAKCLTLVILALMFRRLCPLSRRRGVIACGLAAFLASTALLVLVVNADLLGWAAAGVERGLLVVAGALGGFGYAVALLVWAEVYGRLGIGRVLLFGGVSLVVGPVCYLFIRAMEEPAQLLAMCLVSVAIYPTCIASSRYAGPESSDEVRRSRYPFPWRPVVILALIGFMTRFVNAYILDPTLANTRQIAEIAIGVTIILSLALGKRTRPILLSNLALVVSVAGCACAVAFGGVGRSAAPLLFMTCYLLLTVSVLIMLADVSHQQGVPSMYLFGLACAARVAMGRLGAEAGGALALGYAGAAGSGMGLARDFSAALPLLAAGLTIILLSGAMLLRDHRGGGWSLEGVDIREGRHILSGHERVVRAVEAARPTHRLTARESDVLALLLEGRSYQDVCQSLFLSMSTVKTHAHHAYEKLGVHNRDEAAELLGVSDVLAGEKSSTR
jgi:DNA-binding CsgD family transcriptional regulator/MFS family permease